MRGRILGYDAETFKGVLSGHDGQRYDFVDSDWRGTGDPRPGTEVDFQIDNGTAKDIFPFVETVAQPAQAPQPQYAPPPPQYVPPQPQYVPPPQPQYVAPPPQPQYVPPPQQPYAQPAPPYGQPYPQPGQPYAQQQPYGQQPYGQQPYPPQPMPGQPYAPGYAPPGYAPPAEPHNPSFLHILFSFHGRISRSEFWVKGVLLGGLIWVVVLFVALMIDASLGNINTADSGNAAGRMPVVTTLVYVAIVLWPGLALQVKRWHDRNKSGWFVLFNLIPGFVLGAALGAVRGHEGEASPAAIIAFAAMIAVCGFGIWALIELGFLRGTIGPNRFGGDSVPHY